MGWQFGLLLLGALLASHLIAMALLQRTGQLINPASRNQTVTTLSAVHALAMRGADMELAGADQDRAWLAEAPQVAPFAMLPEERHLAAAVAQALRLPAEGAVWMQIERVSGQQARASVFSPAVWQPLRLRASIALPDGQWLNASLGLQGRYEWSRILLFALPASVLPVLVVAWLVAWRLVRPLRRLIDAAGQLRYGHELPDLPVRGPHEARELTRQFNAMQRRLAQHRDARTRMLAAISHDLRTPVTALRLQAELIDDENLREDMIASLVELQAMVEETLDFARADARAEAWQTVDVAALLAPLERRYQQLGHTVPFTVPTGLRWVCRPIALRRALANLIENALRHAGDAAVRVVLPGPSTAGALCLCVEDAGPGIDPRKLEQVFEPFLQLDDARGPQRQGLGLGLAIARTCVEMQGGTLVLENRSEGGLRAVIRLPAPRRA
ncbi:HAMP domain-containing protein [Corticibacter populi]|uniref:histidine kinase n=1 Tax=Corticibacter populi TaxID=1550736 RepID=A0A3M6QTZ1_9BURK|nr:HAMP domain-containing protein [Corticibacter populi]